MHIYPRIVIGAVLLFPGVFGLPISAAHGGYIEVFADGDGDGLIDHDLEPGMGADYMGVPAPVNSGAAFSAFLATLGPGADIGVEDFESFAGVNPFGVMESAVTLDLMFDRIPPAVGSLPVTAQLVGTGLVANLTEPATVPGAPVDPENESGRFPVTIPVGGDQYFSTNFGELAFTIEFSTPVDAFGFFGSDFGDFNGQTVMDVMGGDGSLVSMQLPHQRTSVGGTENFLNASLLFYGLVGDGMTISRVTFRNEGGIFDRFGFDNLVVATSSSTVIPEPSSMALLWSGLVFGAGAFRRRLRRAGKTRIIMPNDARSRFNG